MTALFNYKGWLRSEVFEAACSNEGLDLAGILVAMDYIPFPSNLIDIGVSARNTTIMYSRDSLSKY